jgi:hypothetical protein
MPSKTEDFIREVNQAAQQCGVQIRMQPFQFGEGVVITWLERPVDRIADLDRFLIEMTSLADQRKIGVQLSLTHNDLYMKNEFTRYGFTTLEDSHHLQMERHPESKIETTEMEFTESAPPGHKAEDFIKHHKKDFHERYGKRWKKVLYATAWKKFGEGMTFRDCLALVESERQD